MADPYANCNFSIPSYQCTLQTCCLAQSSFLYRPVYGGNLFFAIYFALFAAIQTFLGIRWKAWGFGVGMFMGLLLEVLGYIARVLLHNNPFNKNAFLLYLICLTIAPVFISAAIYLCLTRIMIVYGQHLSAIKPRTIAIGFMTSDFCSLVLQALGGALADTSNNHASKQTGINIMIAGLVLQVISLAVFLGFMVYFSIKCRSGVLNMDAGKQACRSRLHFKVFLCSLVFATILILIRSIFRVAELWEGFAGSLWNDQTDFMILDGAMISLAVLCLTAFHPGPAFLEQWEAANWSLRNRAVVEEKVNTTSFNESR